MIHIDYPEHGGTVYAFDFGGMTVVSDNDAHTTTFKIPTLSVKVQKNDKQNLLHGIAEFVIDEKNPVVDSNDKNAVIDAFVHVDSWVEPFKKQAIKWDGEILRTPRMKFLEMRAWKNRLDDIRTHLPLVPSMYDGWWG